jgi:hypothetical protein
MNGKFYVSVIKMLEFVPEWLEVFTAVTMNYFNIT